MSPAKRQEYINNKIETITNYLALANENINLLEARRPDEKLLLTLKMIRSHNHSFIKSLESLQQERAVK